MPIIECQHWVYLDKKCPAQGHNIVPPVITRNKIMCFNPLYSDGFTHIYYLHKVKHIPFDNTT